jgi:hypothetical protein
MAISQIVALAAGDFGGARGVLERHGHTIAAP